MSKPHDTNHHNQSSSSDSDTNVEKNTFSENPTRNESDVEVNFRIPETLLKKLTPIKKSKISLKEKLRKTEERRKSQLNEKISKLNKQTKLILEKLEKLNFENYLNNQVLQDKLIKDFETVVGNRKKIINEKVLSAKKISESMIKAGIAQSVSSVSESDEIDLFENNVESNRRTTPIIIAAPSKGLQVSLNEYNASLVIQRCIRRYLLEKKLKEFKKHSFWKDFKTESFIYIMKNYLNNTKFIKFIDELLSLLRLPVLFKEIWENSKVFLFAFTLIIEYKDSIARRQVPSFNTNLGNKYQYQIEPNDAENFYDDDDVCNFVVVLLHKSATLMCIEFERILSGSDYKEFLNPFSVSRLKLAQIWRRYNSFYKIHADLHLNRCILLGRRALECINAEVELATSTEHGIRFESMGVDINLAQIIKQRDDLIKELKKLNDSKYSMSKSNFSKDTNTFSWATEGIPMKISLSRIKRVLDLWVPKSGDNERSSESSSSNSSSISTPLRMLKNFEFYVRTITQRVCGTVDVVQILSTTRCYLIPPMADVSVWRRIVINDLFLEFMKKDIDLTREIPVALKTGSYFRSKKPSIQRRKGRRIDDPGDREIISTLILTPHIEAVRGIIENVPVVGVENSVIRIKELSYSLLVYVVLYLLDVKSKREHTNVLIYTVNNIHRTGISAKTYFSGLLSFLAKISGGSVDLICEDGRKQIDELLRCVEENDFKVDDEFLVSYLILYQIMFEDIVIRWCEHAIKGIDYDRDSVFERLCFSGLSTRHFKEVYFRNPRLFKFITKYDTNFVKMIDSEHLLKERANKYVNNFKCHEYFFQIYLLNLFTEPMVSLTEKGNSLPEQLLLFKEDIKYVILLIRTTVITCLLVIVLKAVYSHKTFQMISMVDNTIYTTGTSISSAINYDELYVQLFHLVEHTLKSTDGAFKPNGQFSHSMQDIIAHHVLGQCTSEEFLVYQRNGLNQDLCFGYIDNYFESLNLSDETNLKVVLYNSISKQLMNLIYLKEGTMFGTKSREEISVINEAYHNNLKRLNVTCFNKSLKTSPGISYFDIERKVTKMFDFCYGMYATSFIAVYRDIGSPLHDRGIGTIFEESISRALNSREA